MAEPRRSKTRECVLSGSVIDLMVSFQVYTPINQKNLKKKHGSSSQFSWDHVEVVNYLPNQKEVRLLPPPLLTECHSAWLHTLDFLAPLVALTPVSRTTFLGAPRLFQPLGNVACSPYLALR